MRAVRLEGPECASDGTSWLAPLAGHWIEAAGKHLAAHARLVRITVGALRGSAPREPGASMLIGGRSSLGTIGGGRLEWHATRAARQLLTARGSPAVRIEDLILGPQLGQCCGGRVAIWLERLTRRDLTWLEAASRQARAHRGAALESRFDDGVVTHRVCRLADDAGVTLRRDEHAHVLIEPLRKPRPPLWIFGAGHIGQALVRLLAPLALFDIHWIDPRADLLPATLPDGVSSQAPATPVALIEGAPPQTRYVVMTHDHALDFELCRAILERRDCAWLGLIGSAGKSARFRSGLKREGIEPQRLAHLTCPIGLPGISSKLPAAIAIAIAAQLLQGDAAREAHIGNARTGAASAEDATGCGARGGCAACSAARHHER